MSLPPGEAFSVLEPMKKITTIIFLSLSTSLAFALSPESPTEKAAIVRAPNSEIFSQRSAAGSDSRTLRGKLRGVNVLDFGASTANADNTMQIQAAINSLKATGGIVSFPPGDFKVLGQLVGYSGVSLKGVPEMTFIDGTGRTAYQNDILQPLIVYKGTKGSATSLAVDAAYGASTLRVASAAGFSVGQEIELTAVSTGGFSDSSVGVQQGELFFINAISGTELTLNRAILDAAGYAVANHAVVSPVTPVTDFEISGIRLVGLGRDPAGLQAGDDGIGVFYGVNVKIDRNEVRNVDDTAIYAVSCYNCEIDHNKTDFQPKGSSSLINYGIYYAAASFNMRIHDNYGANMRHAVVSGHLSMALKEKYPGINRHIDVSHNTAVNAWLTGIATHNDVEYLDIHDNTIVGGRNGINMRDRNAHAYNNKISACSGVGLYLSANPQQQVWENNSVTGCPIGLGTGSITDGFDMNRLTIQGNEIVGAVSGGINLVDTTNAGPFKDINVVGNAVSDVARGSDLNHAGILFSGAFSGSVERNHISNLNNMTGIILGSTTRNVRLASNKVTKVNRAFYVAHGAENIVGTGNFYAGYVSGLVGASNLVINRDNNDGGAFDH